MQSFRPQITSRELSDGDADASLKTPKQASAFRVGSYIAIRGQHPCRIIEMTQHKTGKHGSGKVSITALHVFTGRKLMDMMPSRQMIEEPAEVTKTDYILVSINERDGGSVHLMDEDNKLFGMPMPKEDVANPLLEAYNNEADIMVTVLRTMGLEGIIGFKKSAKDN